MAEKAFAFRMSPELKEAAKSLTGVFFSEWTDDGCKTVRNVSPSSINEALAYLIRTGAGRAAYLIEHDLEDARTSVEMWGEIVKFFIDHPSANFACHEEFPPGSEVALLIQVGDADIDETGAPPGWPRQDAFDQLAMAQKAFTTRSEAKAALLKAAGRWETP